LVVPIWVVLVSFIDDAQERLAVESQPPGARNARIAKGTLTPASLKRPLERSRRAVEGIAASTTGVGPEHTLRVSERHPFASTAEVHRVSHLPATGAAHDPGVHGLDP
jgi:hypothetical protein